MTTIRPQVTRLEIGSLFKMPLFVDGEIERRNFRSFKELASKYPSIKEIANIFLKQPVRNVDTCGVLYVIQREYATVTPEDENVSVIGSEDATTCHIVALRHAGSGAWSLGHFDGSSTAEGINGMISSLNSLSALSPSKSGEIELHMFGGFCDDQGSSEKLTMSILAAIQDQKEHVHLCTACVVDFNDVVESGLHKPVFYGIGVNTKSGVVFPAKFSDKGPDEAIRHARIFTGVCEMTEIYNSTYKELRIMPYSYRQSMGPYTKFFRHAPDELILQNLSSSPHCEPADFVSTTRATLDHILNHPKPLTTVFHNGQPRAYRRQAKDGSWTRISLSV